MLWHIITQYHKCGIFRIVKMYICCGIYIHISMSGCGRPGSCVLILRSGPLALWPISVHFEFSVIFESQDPGILNQDHRIATRATGSPPGTRQPSRPPGSHIRRSSQIFSTPIYASSQIFLHKAHESTFPHNALQSTSFHVEPNHDFHTQFSLKTENSNRNTLIFNKNEHT